MSCNALSKLKTLQHRHHPVKLANVAEGGTCWPAHWWPPLHNSRIPQQFLAPATSGTYMLRIFVAKGAAN
jgi:hypothetical protein